MERAKNSKEWLYNAVTRIIDSGCNAEIRKGKDGRLIVMKVQKKIAYDTNLILKNTADDKTAQISAK